MWEGSWGAGTGLRALGETGHGRAPTGHTAPIYPDTERRSTLPCPGLSGEQLMPGRCLQAHVSPPHKGLWGRGTDLLGVRPFRFSTWNVLGKGDKLVTLCSSYMWSRQAPMGQTLMIAILQKQSPPKNRNVSPAYSAFLSHQVCAQHIQCM